MLNKIFSLLLCVLILANVLVACDKNGGVEQTTNLDTAAATTIPDESKTAYPDTTATTTMPDESSDEKSDAPSDTAAETSASTADAEATTETESDTESEESTRIDIYPPIPIGPDIPEGTDYENYNFTVLTDDTLSSREFIEEEDGTLITDAIINRRYWVQDLVNIEFSCVDIKGGYNSAERFVSEIQAATGAGCPYDLVLAHNLVAPIVATKGLARDLAESDVLNLSHTTQPYWPQDVNSQIQIGGRFFWATDTVSFNNIRNMICTFVNLEYFEKVNYGHGFVKQDLYNLVDNGKWTMENMFVLAQDAYEDIKYDDEASTNNKALDSYGILADGLGGNLDLWLYGAGFSLTSLNETGTYEWTLDEPIIQDFIGWWQSKLNDDDIYKAESAPQNMFTEGRAMFSISTLGMAEKNIELVYTILPMPLYNSAVKNSYSTPLDDGYASWLIPKGVKNDAFKRSATVLEALAGAANRFGAPYYFEIYLHRQTAAYDYDMQKRFNIIRNSVVFDIGALYRNMVTFETSADYVSPTLALNKVWAGDGTGDYADIETAWAMIQTDATAKLNGIMSDLLDY